MARTQKKPQSDKAEKPKALPKKVQDLLGEQDGKSCFVVMPFGRTSEEEDWFAGWYEQVIQPGVEDAGYKPRLSAAEERPNAISDEIRAHLAYDEMVVVDLGGRRAEDEPNPNVMYELGIRHAIGTPLVIMVWKDQKLPFDVSQQRAVMERRSMKTIPKNRKKLTSFIKRAEQGSFYRPMEELQRFATLEAVADNPDQNEVLRSLTEAVQNMQQQLV